MRKELVVLVIIAMALVGMAGAAPFIISAKNQDTQTALTNSVSGNDPLKFKHIESQPLGATAVNAKGEVIDSMFGNEKYDFGQPNIAGRLYPSVTSLNAVYEASDKSAVIYDAKGNVIDYMTTPTQELNAAQDKEYDANPIWLGGRFGPVSLFTPDCSSVPRGLLVHMNDDLRSW